MRASCGFEQTRDVRFNGDVGADEMRAEPRRQGARVDSIGDRHARPRGDEALDHGLADARSAARHDGHLSAQIEHHRHLDTR
jgi:hypothetical protein